MSTYQYYREKVKTNKERFQITSREKFNKEINDNEYDLEYEYFCFLGSGSNGLKDCKFFRFGIY